MFIYVYIKPILRFKDYYASNKYGKKVIKYA